MNRHIFSEKFTRYIDIHTFAKPRVYQPFTIYNKTCRKFLTTESGRFRKEVPIFHLDGMNIRYQILQHVQEA